ncbi:PP2C family serine/threonine-protein phosphatase [Mycobacterium sp. 141]|uniref:PP2C family serine/threonine-protein phosphatase n=1 Tax=Mycobacterium sp. 141 TaxID=1120797 RepID=UPI00039AE6B5|nr:PP2C family serine/threonine-protein phosphatase [Mycobacterium sp. 141]
MTATSPVRGEPGSWEWAACGASVTGSQHIAKGLGCDDAFGYGIAGDFAVAVIADGAGSVSGTSAWGSFVACQSVLDNAMSRETVRRFMKADTAKAEGLMRWLFDDALDRLTHQAELMRLPLPLLSTTLSVAVATPERTVFGQIGDGIIAVDQRGSVETVLIEDKGEYPNATWFVQTNGAFEESYRSCTLPAIDAFALSTDGMSYKITNVTTGEAYAPFFTGSWDHVRTGADEASFAALLRGIEDDQTGDDKTMVLLVRRWEPDGFHPTPRPTRRLVVQSRVPPRPPDAGREAAVPPAASAKLMEGGAPAPAPVTGARPVAPPPVPAGADSVTEDLRVDAEARRPRLRLGRRVPK